VSPKTLAERVTELERWRTELEEREAQAALERAEMLREALQRWEIGKRNPSPPMLAKLAKATGKPVEFFLRDTPVAA